MALSLRACRGPGRRLLGSVIYIPAVSNLPRATRSGPTWIRSVASQAFPCAAQDRCHKAIRRHRDVCVAPWRSRQALEGASRPQLFRVARYWGGSPWLAGLPPTTPPHHVPRCCCCRTPLAQAATHSPAPAPPTWRPRAPLLAPTRSRPSIAPSCTAHGQPRLRWPTAPLCGAGSSRRALRGRGTPSRPQPAWAGGALHLRRW